MCVSKIALSSRKSTFVNCLVRWQSWEWEEWQSQNFLTQLYKVEWNKTIYLILSYITMWENLVATSDDSYGRPHKDSVCVISICVAVLVKLFIRCTAFASGKMLFWCKISGWQTPSQLLIAEFVNKTVLNINSLT